MSEETKTPEAIAAEQAAATAAAEAAAASDSEELKPLTDEEMESMTTEEITAHAEKFEAQVKGLKKQTPEEIRQNQIIRAKKAQEKANSSTTAPAEKQISTADVLTMAKNDIELGSDEQKLLQARIDQGVIKSYAEGLQHVGVSAELGAIKAKRTAETVIDENADADTQLKTKKEIVAQARTSGEIPEDKEGKAALVEDNLSRMTSLN